ncbi:uncharacterized protein ACUXCC_003601 [Cytobacillus horneckiae]|uniref:Nucleotidase n=1 Tax=Cytobacillus horneckiae TaxID=549687 RepID=A0A2N0ZJJ3_9BACI|nr:HAD hydrolase-like protein [Cytobacillus horneckiae]MBN6888643.1 HAD hydrolase-like protein [Cytobacillus horneckiae]MCM3180549.1 HAD hydrolase-like protein [Cytobacillus horneckiae]MEC1154077.1 HAD family acid phosphatase [Cytobacillus horneckiae]MED2938652.1 HAD family acid phosphatase [Cytobacillus horneckiae]PKG29699.1 hypothetical protein CWS20_07475 [Cytobacillus horneckiae]
MRFGFDIDDTLINLREHAFHIYNRKLNQTIDLNEFHKLNTLEIHTLYGLSDIEGKEMWNDSLEEIYFTDCAIFSGALDFLKELEQQGHEIFYITARNKAYCRKTKEWMIKQGFPVKDGNFYCGMKDHEKINIIQKLSLDYYFDDKPEVLNTLTDESVSCFVKDQSYNRAMNLPRLVDWSEYHEKLKAKGLK